MKIFKYELERKPGDQEVTMPDTAHPLSVGNDPENKLCVWAAVDPSFPQRARIIHLAMTGGEAPMVPVNPDIRVTDENGERVRFVLPDFLGTVLDDTFFMIHCFDLGWKKRGKK